MALKLCFQLDFSFSSQNAYRLKWNDFEPNIITSAFGSIREDGELFDVTLVARGGRSIKAHKMVLAACSPLFRYE